MKWISMGLDVDSIKWADRKRGRQFTGRWTVLAVLALVLTSSHIAMAGNWADVENRDTNWTYSTAAGANNFIATARQLAQFAWLINQGTNFAGTVTIITADIDLSAHAWTTAGFWRSVSDNKSFAGTLTVGTPGLTIYGLTINYMSASGIALFGAVSGRVEGLTLTGVNVRSRKHVGAIAGFNRGTIANCVVNGKVHGVEKVGGLVGENYGTILDCVNHAAVLGVQGEDGVELYYIGGMAGRHAAGTIVNCVNHGAISAKESAGGIAGGTAGGTVVNCVNRGTITSSQRAGGISGDVLMGLIANCANHGRVAGRTGGVNGIAVGGVAGGSAYATLINNINRGAVSGDSECGGVVGSQQDGVVENCVNLGTVFGTKKVGGIVGHNFDDGTVRYNYLKTGTMNGDVIANNDEDGTFSNCATFGSAPGTLGATIYDTTSLLDALNAWVADNPTYTHSSANLSATVAPATWRTEGSLDGYPVFATGSWAEERFRDLTWEPSLTTGATNVIATAAQLAQFAWLVNQGNSFSGTVNIVTRDIDLSAYLWVPAGTSANRFAGTLMGDAPGRAIAGLTIDEAGLYHAGLFGSIAAGGRVSAITLNNVYINAAGNLGAIAGENRGTIANCAASGTLSGSAGVVGGLVGLNSGTIANSANRVAVSGTASAGGIVGYNTGGITNTVNLGTIAGAQGYVGAIAGSNSGTVRYGFYQNGTASGAVGYGTAAVDSATFGTPPGFISGPPIHQRSKLVDVLNGYVEQTPMLGDMTLFTWTLGGSPDGYPVFFDSRSWLERENRDMAWTYSEAPGAVNFIDTAAQLAQFAWLVNQGKTFADTVNIVTRDIDISARYWEPVGSGNNNEFDGLFTVTSPGIAISGITIDNDALNYAGLFGTIAPNGRVRSITLNNVNIRARLNVGAIAGYNRGTIVNCTVSGTVIGNNNGVGGIVGMNSGAIVNNLNYAAVSGNTTVGGIVGMNNTSASVLNAVNHGAVSGTGSNIGTIVGYNANTNTFLSVYHVFFSGEQGTNAVGAGTSSGFAFWVGKPPGQFTIFKEPLQLLDVLNVYVASHPETDGIALSAWTLTGSPDGYPVLVGDTATVRGIPYTWLDGYGLVVSNNYEAAAADTSRKGYPLWHDYISGVNPTNLDARFTVHFTNGLNIGWTPDLSASGRVYKVYASTNLLSTNWVSPPATNTATAPHIFHVTVELNSP